MKYLVIMLSVLALAACQQTEPEKNTSATIKEQNTTMITVTVKYLEFEGGFYGLVTQDGKKLLPMNLAPEYRKAGTVIKVSGKQLTDVMTIQQWGTPYQISEVELVKMGRSAQE